MKEIKDIPVLYFDEDEARTKYIKDSDSNFNENECPWELSEIDMEYSICWHRFMDNSGKIFTLLEHRDRKNNEVIWKEIITENGVE